MLAPFLVCQMPVLDSLHGSGKIRVWERGRMGFVWVDRQEAPWSYWINLLVNWPGTVIFAVALVKMTRRLSGITIQAVGQDYPQTLQKVAKHRGRQFLIAIQA